MKLLTLFFRITIVVFAFFANVLIGIPDLIFASTKSVLDPAEQHQPTKKIDSASSKAPTVSGAKQQDPSLYWLESGSSPLSTNPIEAVKVVQTPHRKAETTDQPNILYNVENGKMVFYVKQNGNGYKKISLALGADKIRANGDIISVKAVPGSQHIFFSTQNAVYKVSTETAGIQLTRLADLTQSHTIPEKLTTVSTQGSGIIPLDYEVYLLQDRKLHVLPLAPLAGYSPPTQPQLFYSEKERNDTLSEWNTVWNGTTMESRFRYPGSNIPVLTVNQQKVILDVLTTLRLGAPTYWQKFMNNISVIYMNQDSRAPDGVSATLSAVTIPGGGRSIGLYNGFFGRIGSSYDWNSLGFARQTLLKILVHEGYHHPGISSSLDSAYGVSPGELVAGGASSGTALAEEDTEWRTAKTINAIGQTLGWSSIYGNDSFHFTDKNHAYQEVCDGSQSHCVKYYYYFRDFDFPKAAEKHSTNPFWIFASGRPGEGAFFINNARLFASGRIVLKIELKP